MKIIYKIKKQVDDFVSSHKSLSYAKDIQSSYNKNNGHLRVGSITYYMFMSILPLLIVSLTIFDIVFSSNPRIKQDLIDSTLSTIPVIGPTLESNLSFVKERGITLIITLTILLWTVRRGALALDSSLQAISKRSHECSNVFTKILRAYGTMIIIGIGFFVPTLLSSIFNNNLLMQSLVLIFSILWNILLLFLIFVVLIDRKYATRKGTVIGGLAISLIQFFSVFIVSRSLENSRPLYGTLAVVLALLIWIALQIKIVLYSAVINTFDEK
ncbi:MAG: YihY/virulence factor BrkB family protein [Acidimicrobiia bacterium]|nr:YihY/virulence factor BrkB family protein [Acidimicrobiia bacterium]